ncbi:MAG: hypothetical protein V3U90_00685 [Dehalococcoidia bacterium]
MTQHSYPVPESARRNVPWRHVWIALAISVAGTTILGGGLFIIQQNVWWIALGGIVSLFGGSIYLGWRSGESEPLYGALLAILYFGPAVGILFGGMLANVEEFDPLPGLGRGDSTFFFVWPLLQLVASAAGAVIGGRLDRSHNPKE